MDVLEYDDYRAYLRDWFEASGHSHRAVMRRLRSKDPSVLRRVITGERPLSAGLVEPLISLMELDAPGAKAFRLLMAIAHPRTADEAERAHLQLRGLRASQRAQRLLDPGVYAHWCRPMLHELTRFSGYRASPEWIASVVEAPLSEAEITDAIEAVRRHKGASLVTDSEVRRREVFGYYRGIQNCTAHALDRLEDDPDYVERSQFLALTLGIPQSLVPQLRKRLLEVQQELLGLADAESGSPELVVQVNLQLFPLTHRVLHGEAER